MMRYVTKFERAVTAVLLLMMVVVVVLSVADLGLLLARDIVSPPIAFLDEGELIEIFGFFLLVLIGIELLETIKAYVNSAEIRTEMIILAALIALSRKLIILKIENMSSASLLGLAAAIVALGITYFLVRQSHRRAGRPVSLNEDEA